MNLSFDTVVAGAGLAGTTAAFVLSSQERVLVVDDQGPGAGASGIPLGLVSPLMSRRARPVWRMPEAVAALDRLLRESYTEHHFRRSGVLKPASSEEQAFEFQDAAARWPEHGAWHGSTATRSRWPRVNARYGVLEVVSGGSVSMPDFCSSLLRAAMEQGARFQQSTRVVSWRESDDAVHIALGGEHAADLTAGRLLMAVGAGYRSFPEIQRLRLHPIKGQWIRLACSPPAKDFVPVSSRRYVAAAGSHFIVGSTYEHEFIDDRPTEIASTQLHEAAVDLVPSLAGGRVLESAAAVRVTVPGIRLPMVGPLPGRRRVWIFTGLGSKGLLMAPLLAGELPEFFTQPEEIPEQIRVI